MTAWRACVLRLALTSARRAPTATSITIVKRAVETITSIKVNPRESACSLQQENRNTRFACFYKLYAIRCKLGFHIFSTAICPDASTITLVLLPRGDSRIIRPFSCKEDGFAIPELPFLLMNAPGSGRLKSTSSAVRPQVSNWLFGDVAHRSIIL